MLVQTTLDTLNWTYPDFVEGWQSQCSGCCAAYLLSKLTGDR
jgi:hypothetical protein